MSYPETPFQLTPPWFDLGIITPARLAALEAAWADGDDPYPEHYRWGAFSDFLAAQRPLAPELAEALYALGAADPDPAMGASMMRAIVVRPECPPSVLAAARQSGRAFLVKAAARPR